MKHVNKFDEAVQHLNKGKDGIYGFPTSVSSLTADTPSEGLEPTFAAYGRWDLYEAIGSPSIDTLEGLLPVLEKMQKENPTTESGKKTYAFSLFSDWDGNMMNVASN